MSEEKDTANSGAPVPKATMVRPIRSFETLKFDATEDVPSTSQPAPLMSKTNPMINSVTCRIISIYLFLLSLCILYVFSQKCKYVI